MILMLSPAGNEIVSLALHEGVLRLIHFKFNRSIRLYARKKGYSLNQRGLSIDVIRGKDGMKQTEGD